MTNSEINTTEFGTNVAGPNTDHKKPVLANKKVVLQDVQNDNSNSTRNAAGPTAVHEKPVLAAKKVALQDVQNDNSNFTRNVAGPTTVNKEPVLAAKKVVLQDVQNDNRNVAGPTSVHKKAVLATKKVALQDVQNDNSNSTRNVAGPTIVHKEPVADACKTIGTKRVAPDHASSPILTNNGAHEFEGNRKKNAGQPKSGSVTQIQQEAGLISGKNVLNGSLVGPNQTALKPYVSRLKESNDEQWTERFIRLQNFIKQCDGSDHRENTQCMLRVDFFFFFFFFFSVELDKLIDLFCSCEFSEVLVRLSPSELCKHAVELEKRAIQLTIEEGKEMERMQALNILGTPLLTRNPIPITQQKN
ncbi:putative Zinc finger, SWIM-type [Helianthus annuus]|nr:putative Zinc finger, SWIM-type [Helianthus annuus]